MLPYVTIPRRNEIPFASIQDLTAASKKMTAFRDAAPCRVVWTSTELHGAMSQEAVIFKVQFQLHVKKKESKLNSPDKTDLITDPLYEVQ